MQDNYFKVFDLPVSFRPDMQLLKTRFYAFSRQYHPDYHAGANKETQDEMLQMSGVVNTAYKVLSDDRERMKYILTIEGAIKDGEKPEVPQEFLIEMMEINEAIFDLKMDFDKVKYNSLLQDLELLEKKLQTELDRGVLNFESNIDRKGGLDQIKDYFLKTSYLLRIRENLSTFAAT